MIQNWFYNNILRLDKAYTELFFLLCFSSMFTERINGNNMFIIMLRVTIHTLLVFGRITYYSSKMRARIN